MKTRQETNIIGVMLLALVFFLVIGMAMQIGLNGRMMGVEDITGAATGIPYVFEGDTLELSKGSVIIRMENVENIQRFVWHKNKLYSVEFDLDALKYNLEILTEDRTEANTMLRNNILGEGLLDLAETSVELGYFDDDGNFVELTYVKDVELLGAKWSNLIAADINIFALVGEPAEQVAVAKPATPPGGITPQISAADFNLRIATAADKKAFEDYLRSIGKSETDINRIMGNPTEIAVYQLRLGLSGDGKIGGGTGAAARTAVATRADLEKKAVALNLEIIPGQNLDALRTRIRGEQIRLGQVPFAERTFDVVIEYEENGEKKTITGQIKAATLADARVLALEQIKGLPNSRIVEIKEVVTPILGIYQVHEIAGKVYARNGINLIPVPSGIDPQEFADELNARLALNTLSGGKILGIDKDGKYLAKKGNEIFRLSTDNNVAQFGLIGTIDKNKGLKYITRSRIGDVLVTKTHDISEKVTQIEVTDADGNKALVNQEILTQIRNAGGNNFVIVQEGTATKDQILGFTNKNGNRVEVITKPGFSLTSGERTINVFGTKYFYQGRTITKKEYGELIEPVGIGNKGLTKMEVLINTHTQSIIPGGFKFFTTFNQRMDFDAKYNPTQIIEVQKWNNKGELIQFIYTERDRNEVEKKAADGKCQTGNNCDNAFLLRASSAKEAFEIRRIFSYIESALTSFRGLGFYATLFFSDEELEDFREKVDKFFAENYLGIEYWESAICASKIDRGNEGVAYVDTKLGLSAVAAHIEASISHPAELPPGSEEQREFLYKITFNIKNGDWDKDPKALEKMRFNIKLKGERTIDVYDQELELNRGDQLGRIGANAIVQYSNFRYKQICIEFDKVPSSWSLDNKELCNRIMPAPSEPLRIEESAEVTAEEDESQVVDF